MESGEWDRALNPFTWDEFASCLAVKAKNTAPGKSSDRGRGVHTA
jgi:hypothetical protein